MKREEQGRVWESDLVLPGLRVMSKRQDGFISITELTHEFADRHSDYKTDTIDQTTLFTCLWQHPNPWNLPRSSWTTK